VSVREELEESLKVTGNKDKSQMWLDDLEIESDSEDFAGFTPAQWFDEQVAQPNENAAEEAASPQVG
jgi:hypothetical protein